jgi:F-type H+-transporting ATPase subunit delta
MAGQMTVQGIYAQALLEAATERDALEVVKDELAGVVPALSGGRVSDFLRTPNIAREAKISALKDALGGKVSETLLNFLLMVVRRGRQAQLPAIHDSFLELYRAALNLVDVEVRTAHALEEEQRSRLEASLSERYGRGVLLREQVDASLLGGIVVRTDAELVDASLQARLRRMKEQLGQSKAKSGEFYEDQG